MAIDVGEHLTLDELLEKHPLDRSNYIDRLTVREYRELLRDIEARFNLLEGQKSALIDLNKDVKGAPHAQR